MRIVLPALLVTCLAGAAQAQPAGGFDDVPPWHWASQSIQGLAAAGILVGYPTTDRDRALNAVVQTYDAFAHAGHPEARAWAERFLTNLPANWPEPLRRSRLLHFSLSAVRIETNGSRATVTLTAIVILRVDGGTARRQAPLRLTAERDADGRWRVNYAALAAGQPEVFR